MRKGKLKSKTLGASALFGAAGAQQAVTAEDPMQGLIMMGMSLAFAVLRFYTSTSVR